MFLNNWKVSVGNSYEIMSWTFIEKESNSAAKVENSFKREWKLYQFRLETLKASVIQSLKCSTQFK